MSHKNPRPDRRCCTINWTAFVLIMVLLLTSCVPTAMPQSVVGQHLPPQLLSFVHAHPDKNVSVIVQKTAPDARVEDVVAELGGVVTKDLHILRAFAAELPGRAVLRLAENPKVRWISLDRPVESTGKGGSKGRPSGDGCTDCPLNTYLDTLDVRRVWEMGYDGSGIGVAVIDSGIATDRDFSVEPGSPFSRIRKQVGFNPNSFQTTDFYGHGTHVAGIVGGNGDASGGAYMGIAPKVDLINLKISDDTGMAYESDTVAAMQWILENKEQYNIRVVNLSINSVDEQSYHTSPLDAAAEILWFNGVVVVAAAGNKGPDNGYNPVLASPANDPFVITVGASDEKGDAQRSNDIIASYTAYDETVDGFIKPELIAPGTNIVSVLASSSTWDVDHPDRLVLDKEYIRLSGTSMAAPMVTGAVALILQAEPTLTPDQVKYRLLNSAGRVGKAAYLDVYAAVTATTTESANTGLVASQLLWTGDEPITWSSVSWNSVSWNSVSWNSVSWNSVSWNSVSWNSVSWDEEVTSASSFRGDVSVHEAEGTEDTVTTEDTDDEQVNIVFLPFVNR